MSSSGYLSLCYHYFRPQKKDDLFPDLLGCRGDGLRQHVAMLKKNYTFLSLSDAQKYSKGKFEIPGNKLGMLMTFDDGLSDHYEAARVLSEYGIPAVFFIPTCALMDRTPSSPNFIHYCIARYRLTGFLKAYNDALEAYGLKGPQYKIPYTKGQGDPWDTIKAIKKMFKYSLGYREGRDVLLHIYKNTLLKEFPNAVDLIHLTEDQVKRMVAMGHAIGVHSHSHISVAASQLTPKEFEKEVIEPKRYLEKTFKTPVTAFSYPFGERKDCLSTQALISKTQEYQLAFTVETILNTKETSPFELGRYMPMSTDDDVTLASILSSMAEGSYAPS